MPFLRAGVPVGTALLKAALKCHLDKVTEALELVCHHQRGISMQQMATALTTRFLAAKMSEGNPVQPGGVSMLNLSAENDPPCVRIFNRPQRSGAFN
jgi:hypothetical protein